MPSRLVRRYKRRKHKGESSSPRSNPPMFQDLVEFIGPGFAGFAVSRFGTRIATTQIGQRWPSWGKHAGGVAAVGSFLAAWLLAHKVKLLEKFHTPIVVGAGIAALQSLIQLYIPRLGWMVSDASPELAAGAAGATAASLAAGTTSAPQQLPPGYQTTSDDPSLYVYTDQYDAGRMSQPQPTGTAAGQQASQQTASDDMADLEYEDDLQTMGAL